MGLIYLLSFFLPSERPIVAIIATGKITNAAVFVLSPVFTLPSLAFLVACPPVV